MLRNWLLRLIPLRPERVYVITAVAAGLLFSLLTAPFQAPDEYVHFFRAYLISTGSPFTAEGAIPASVERFSRDVSQDLPGNDQNKQSKRALLDEFSRKFEDQPQAQVNVRFTMIYSPAAYVPQVVGILAGRLLRLPPLVIFWLARLANLAAWVLLVWLAIRITPIHKWVFFTLALMPMSIFLAASCSADPLTNGLSLLWVALLLRMLFSEDAATDWRQWGWLALVGAGLALTKSIYAALVLLLVLLPLRHKAHGRGLSARAGGLVLLVALISVGWLNFSSRLADVMFVSGSGGRLSYALAHPDVLAQLFFNALRANFFTQARMYIGVLGWADTPLAEWVYPLAYALLIAAALLDARPAFVLRLYEKTIIAALGLLLSAALIFAFFEPQASVEAGLIRLAQGRYFIPFGALYFLPLYNQRLRQQPGSPAWAALAAKVLLMAGVILLLLAALRALLWRYYAI